MKKILLLLTTFFTVHALAQIQSSFKTSDRNIVTNFVNNVLSTTIKKYIQVQIDSVKCKKCISFWYSDGENFLYIDFWKISEGGNTDLGTPDTMYYKLATVRGIYKDLFPFWKKNFQEDAEFEKIAFDKHARVIQFKPTRYVATFNRGEVFWQIELKEY